MAKRKGIMGRSDIPFAQRMLMKKQAIIVHNREQAAKVVMFCNAVALNELEGIGYKRLTRYAMRFKRINDDFYEDPLVSMAHAKHRMEQMGMPISGELFTTCGENALDTEMLNHSLQAAQIALICAALAMNEEFQLGRERQERVSARTDELAAQYREEGIQFLYDKLQKIGFNIVDGEARCYLDDDGKPITVKKAINYLGEDFDG